MPTRKRYRSTGALVSQILSDNGSLTSDGVSSSKWTDFEHRSSKMVLKRIQVDAAFALGATGSLQSCEFAVIAKPISEGVPVLADMDNEKYVKWIRNCSAVRNTVADQAIHTVDVIHIIEILKIIVEIGWDLYMTVHNSGSGTNPFEVWMRLFVKYI